MVPFPQPCPLPDRPDEFSFVLLSDRTGMAQPGVFERAVAITNLLRPDFVVQIGDTIEGYTRDPASSTGSGRSSTRSSTRSTCRWSGCRATTTSATR
jgi:hypothetical protein